MIHLYTNRDRAEYPKNQSNINIARYFTEVKQASHGTCGLPSFSIPDPLAAE